MHYTVFVAFNAILLLLGSVDSKKIRSRPFTSGGNEDPPLRRGYELPPLPTPWNEDPDIEDDCQCSDLINTELTKIRADLRTVKSLVEGLRQKLDPDFKPMETEEPTASQQAVKSLVEGLSQKFDPESKPVETEEPTAEPKPCPEGFDYLPEARGCYKAIAETLQWSSAMEECESLNARLISIESPGENEEVTKYLNKKFARRSFRTRSKCSRPGQPEGYAAFWTSGQRVNMSDCRSEFVWKATQLGEAPFTYTQWLRGEPNCWGGDEKCAELLLGKRSNWNDVMCYVYACPLCEYDLN